MPIMFHEGKILFRDGKIAFDPNCCCGASCCPAPNFPLHVNIPVAGNIETSYTTPDSTKECDACESIPDDYSLTSELDTPWPGSEYSPIDNFHTLGAVNLGFSGVRVAGWWYKATSICSIAVQHFMGFVFGCEDNEGDQIDFAIRASLYYDADADKCYFATQWAVWTPSPSGSVLGKHYTFGYRTGLGNTDGFSAPVTCKTIQDYLMGIILAESSSFPDLTPCGICTYNTEDEDVPSMYVQGEAV